MKILLLAVGTTGDVLPFIAIGDQLKKMGHDVTINTHADYKDLVTSFGLKFHLIGGSFKELAGTKEGKAWLESGDNLIKYMSTATKLFKPIFAEWVKVDKILPEFDAAVCHPFAAYSYNTAERYNIPFIIASLIPWFFSGEIEPILVPFVSPLFTSWCNKTLNLLTIKILWSLFKDLNRARRKELGLKPIRPDNLWLYLQKIAVPHLNLYSPHVIPEPKDIPDYCFVTGFCFLDSKSSYTPPPYLVDFLANGEPPIYIGFGSMTGKEPAQLTDMIVHAVRKAKKRAILLTGWGGMKEPTAGKDILIIKSVPHEWLFPRVKAVIHHGGVGTTAAGLRAGKPTGIVAFFGDQPFWGRRVQALKVGPKPMVKNDLNAEHLALLIQKVCSNSLYEKNAQKLGQAIRQENGIEKATQLIQTYFTNSALRK
jgi:sterol 3beta-glucosyltransferase